MERKRFFTCLLGLAAIPFLPKEERIPDMKNMEINEALRFASLHAHNKKVIEATQWPLINRILDLKLASIAGTHFYGPWIIEFANPYNNPNFFETFLDSPCFNPYHNKYEPLKERISAIWGIQKFEFVTAKGTTPQVTLRHFPSKD